MTLKDKLTAAIMLIALVSIPFLLFGNPTGLSAKAFGAVSFGIILVFGAVNLILVWWDSVGGKKR